MLIEVEANTIRGEFFDSSVEEMNMTTEQENPLVEFTISGEGRIYRHSNNSRWRKNWHVNIIMQSDMQIVDGVEVETWNIEDT